MSNSPSLKIIASLLGVLVVIVLWLELSGEDKKPKVFNLELSDLESFSYQATIPIADLLKSRKKDKEGKKGKVKDKKKKKKKGFGKKSKKGKSKSKEKKKKIILTKEEIKLQNYIVKLSSRMSAGLDVEALKIFLEPDFGDFFHANKKKYEQVSGYLITNTSSSKKDQKNKKAKKFRINKRFLRNIKDFLNWRLKADHTIDIDQLIKKSNRYKDIAGVHETFGLDQPLETITIVAKAQKYILNIGKLDPSGNKYYTLLNSKDHSENIIYQLPSYLLKKMRIKTRAVLAKTLSYIQEDFVTRVEWIVEKSFLSNNYWYPEPKKPRELNPPKSKKKKKKKGKKSAKIDPKVIAAKKEEYSKTLEVHKNIFKSLKNDLTFSFNKVQKITPPRKNSDRPPRVSTLWKIEDKNNATLKVRLIQSPLRKLLGLSIHSYRRNLKPLYQEKVPSREKFTCRTRFKYYVKHKLAEEFCLDQMVKLEEREYFPVKTKNAIGLIEKRYFKNWLK